MKKSKQKPKRSKTIVVKLPITLVIVAIVMVAMFAPFVASLYDFKFYEKQYEENGVFDILGRDNTFLATFNLFNFFRCKDTLDTDCKGGLTGEYPTEDKTYSFSEDEISHLQDVKNLFIGVTWIMIFFLLILVFFGVFLLSLYIRRSKSINFFSIMSKILVRSGGYFFGVLALFGIILLFFKQSFAIFHYIFFPQGNWTFSSDSLLITLFPQDFFLNFISKLVGIYIVELVLILGLGFAGLFWLKRKKINAHK